MQNIAPLMLNGSAVAEQFGETHRSAFHPAIESERLDLAGFARVLWRRKFLVLVTSAVIAILCAGAISLLPPRYVGRSEEHTSELQSHLNLVCRLLLEKKKLLKTVSVLLY